MPDNTYSPAVLEHFRRPRHGGRLDGDDASLCMGCAGAVKSGTEVRFELRVSADDRIIDVAWQAYGCPSTLASASWLAERVLGLSGVDAGQVTALDMVRALDVSPQRRSVTMIVEDALGAALRSRFRAGSGQSSNSRR